MTDQPKTPQQSAFVQYLDIAIPERAFLALKGNILHMDPDTAVYIYNQIGSHVKKAEEVTEVDEEADVTG